MTDGPRRLRPPLTTEQSGRVRGATRMVKRLARQLAARLGFERDELVSTGHEALVEAAQTYTADRGTQFELFAWSRVRGEMLDGAAKFRAHSRGGVLRAMRQAGQAIAETVDQGGDVLTDTDEMTVGRIEAACDDVATAMLAGFSGGFRRADPEEQLAMKQCHDLTTRALEQALASLDAQELKLIELYYGEDRPLVEVAETLGIPYRTIRRYHHEVIERLRKRLALKGVTAAVAVEART